MASAARLSADGGGLMPAAATASSGTPVALDTDCPEDADYVHVPAPTATTDASVILATDYPDADYVHVPVPVADITSAVATVLWVSQPRDSARDPHDVLQDCDHRQHILSSPNPEDDPGVPATPNLQPSIAVGVPGAVTAAVGARLCTVDTAVAANRVAPAVRAVPVAVVTKAALQAMCLEELARASAYNHAEWPPPVVGYEMDARPVVETTSRNEPAAMRKPTERREPAATLEASGRQDSAATYNSAAEHDPVATKEAGRPFLLNVEKEYHSFRLNVFQPGECARDPGEPLQVISRCHAWVTPPTQIDPLWAPSVADPQLFKRRFHERSGHILSEAFDFSNVLVIGGFVQACLVADDALYESVYAETDIDLYIHGIEDNEAFRRRVFDIVRYLQVLAEQRHGGCLVVRTRHAINVCLGTPAIPNIQIILQPYRAIEHVLCTTDLDCTAAGFDGHSVWATPRARESYNRRWNIIRPEKWGVRGSPDSERRLVKYAVRGFAAVDIHVDVEKLLVRMQKEAAASNDVAVAGKDIAAASVATAMVASGGKGKHGVRDLVPGMACGVAGDASLCAELIAAGRQQDAHFGCRGIGLLLSDSFQNSEGGAGMVFMPRAEPLHVLKERLESEALPSAAEDCGTSAYALTSGPSPARIVADEEELWAAITVEDVEGNLYTAHSQRPYYLGLEVFLAAEPKPPLALRLCEAAPATRVAVATNAEDATADASGADEHQRLLISRKICGPFCLLKPALRERKTFVPVPAPVPVTRRPCFTARRWYRLQPYRPGASFPAGSFDIKGLRRAAVCHSRGARRQTGNRVVSNRKAKREGKKALLCYGSKADQRGLRRGVALLRCRRCFGMQISGGTSIETNLQLCVHHPGYVGKAGLWTCCQQAKADPRTVGCATAPKHQLRSAATARGQLSAGDACTMHNDGY